MQTKTSILTGNFINSNLLKDENVKMAQTGSPEEAAFIMENAMDIVILIVFSLIVWLLAWKNQGIGRKEGFAMLALYIIYMVYICMR